MTAKELISELWDLNPHLKKTEVEKLIKTYSDFVTKAVLDGNEVLLPGVGNFYVSASAPGKKYNPRTKEIVSVPGGVRRIKFRMFPSVGK